MKKKERNTTEKTVKFISDMIVENNYMPGDRIPSEYELAERFGVSRLTVREAVKILVSNNMLYIKRGVGTFVSDNIKSDMMLMDMFYTEDKQLIIKEVFETRMILEPEIVKMACKRATENDIAEMRECSALCKEKYEEGVSHFKYDEMFHIQLAKSAHNELILKIMSSMKFMMEEAYKALGSDNLAWLNVEDAALHGHDDIINFIEEKDEIGAELTIRHHLNRIFLYMKTN